MTTTSLRTEITNELIVLYDPREADQVAALVIENLFGITPINQLMGKEINLTRQIQKKLAQIIHRLLKHEPIQYVLGHTEFFGRLFKTDSSVLIPRPETEELVHWILQGDLNDTSRVLDIGTGSGCIAITLALEAKCKSIGIDNDPSALLVSKENAREHGVEIEWLELDILEKTPVIDPVDLIVSNPPYVPHGDRGQMDSRVKDFEPVLALFVPDNDPLIFYRRIVALAPHILKPGGTVYLEIYHQAGKAVCDLFTGRHWSQVNLKKDLQGRNRMVSATLNAPQD